MRLPAPSATWFYCRRFGIYVGRKLRAALLTELADPVKASTLSVQTLGRAWEDADITVQEAFADRDAVDEALAALAREVRRTLISRSANAEKTAPYLLIVPDGIGWYTNAPVDEELSRFKQLRDRLTSHLTDSDALRIDLLPRLQSTIDAYSNAAQGLEDARNAETRTRDELEHAVTGWRDLMDRTHGSLKSQLGGDAAESFFPKTRKAQKAAGSSEAGENGSSAPGTV